ncbi:MAG: STAS domain-containing protein, partial [Pirellulales bacterium]
YRKGMAAMELQLLEAGDNFTHVALIGKLDMAGVDAISGEFQAAVAGRGNPAIVDLSQVDFMASMGMGMLVNAARTLKQQGRPMVLLRPQPLVAGALELVKIHLVIPIVDTLEEAFRICQEELPS